MKVILGCDPLLAPLTGIGQYTQEIGLGLLAHTKVNELSLFAHGKYYNNDLLKSSDMLNLTNEVNEVNEVNEANDAKSGLLPFLRRNLAKSDLVVSMYGKLIPLIEKRALQGKQDYVFHSPNFLLPNHGGKRIVTIHDLSTLVHPEFHPASRVKLVNNAIEQSVKFADHIITDTEFIKHQLCESFALSRDKVTAIHLGVNKQYFPRTEVQCAKVLGLYGLSYKQFLLFVSTIEPRKNVLRLLQAYQLYREKHSQGLPLIMVGSPGWRSDKEHRIIKQLEAKGWVKYLGYVRQSDIPVLYAASKGLLFPSLYEGFGLPVAEALQSGVQVLTSENSAMSEFAKEKTYLVNPYCVESIKAGIEKLVRLDQLLFSIPFSWENTVQATIESYEC